MGSGKQFIIPVLVLIVVIGASAAVYSLYFKPQALKYKQDQETLAALEQKLDALSKKFKGTAPDVVVGKWRTAVNPWVEARDRRAAYFSLGDVLKVDPIPEGKFPKFWYEEQFNKIRTKLYEDAYRRGCPIPNTTFGAVTPDQLSTSSVKKEDVEKWLRQLQFGCSIIRLFMDNNATAIYDVSVWTPRDDFKVLKMRTVGVHFAMSLEHLVQFLSKLEQAKQYYAVDALSIRNPSLRNPRDPQLDVSMLLTQTIFNKDAATKPQPLSATAGAGGAAPAAASPFDIMSAMRRPTAAAPEEESLWQKIWPF